MISDESIEQLLADYPQSARELYEVACLNEGADNVSVIVAKLKM